MEFKDYYKVLGVEAQASADEVKRAFRRLARKYHPDVSREPDAEARFKEVNEAYEVLKDPEKRQAYDELRSSPFRHGPQFEPPPDWHFDAGFRGGGFTQADVSGFSDFFRTLFGEQGGFSPRARTGPRASFSGRGEDLHSRLEITLPEAYAGTTRRLQIARPAVAPDGRVSTENKVLELKVPAGVTQGRRIRLRGQGGPGIGDGAAGDLYCEIVIVPHRQFALDVRDVTLTLPVAPWEAAMGATVQVPTLGGRVELRIPAGSQAGTRLRLRGRGLPGHPPGDQFVVLKIVTPPPTTERQRALYRQMAEQFDYDPRREAGMGG